MWCSMDLDPMEVMSVQLPILQIMMVSITEHVSSARQGVLVPEPCREARWSSQSNQRSHGQAKEVSGRTPWRKRKRKRKGGGGEGGGFLCFQKSSALARLGFGVNTMTLKLPPVSTG